MLHSFAGGSDGGGPQAGLININGILYGTTSNGGSSGDGTVFSVTTSGSEKVLHSFSGPPDGDFPIAGLTNVDGTIYGTTDDGGFSKTCYPSSGCGTVFSMDASGNEKVLYSFGGPPDGAGPMANLLNVSGTLYGTTQSGGAYYKGTVFSITASGQEAVLHTFRGTNKSHPDGDSPMAGLIDIKGTLFGTTAYGGAPTSGCKSQEFDGCGTVFSISP